MKANTQMADKETSLQYLEMLFDSEQKFLTVAELKSIWNSIQDIKGTNENEPIHHKDHLTTGRGAIVDVEWLNQRPRYWNISEPTVCEVEHKPNDGQKRN